MPLFLSPFDALAADPPESVIPARYQKIQAPVVEVDPFRWEVTPLDLSARSKGRAEVRLVVPDGYHVYRDMVTFSVRDPGGLVVEPASLPPGIPVKDPADGTVDREIYSADAVVWLPVTTPRTPGLYFVHVEARYQGCREGLCYPPSTAELDVPVHVHAENR
jgi:thiol:disulfide interchange protein